MSAFPRGPWAIITPAALAERLVNKPIIVRDEEGHAAAARYGRDGWRFYTDDGTRPPLDFEPSHYSPGAPVRAGFVVEPVA